MLPRKLSDAGGGSHTNLMHTSRTYPNVRFVCNGLESKAFSSPPTIHLPHFLRVLILGAKILRTPPVRLSRTPRHTCRDRAGLVRGCPVRQSLSPVSLWPHGREPARLLCPRNSPGKNTRVGCHSLHQGIVPTQGSHLGLLDCRQVPYHLSHQGSRGVALSCGRRTLTAQEKGCERIKKGRREGRQSDRQQPEQQVKDTWGTLATGHHCAPLPGTERPSCAYRLPLPLAPATYRAWAHSADPSPAVLSGTPPCRCPPPFHSGKPLLIFPTSAPPLSPPSPTPQPCADISLWVFPTYSALHTMSLTQLHCLSSLAFYLSSPVPLLIFVGQIQGTQQALNTGRINWWLSITGYLLLWWSLISLLETRIQQEEDSSTSSIIC